MVRTALIERLVAQGGPAPSDYVALTQWVGRLHEDLVATRVSHAELAQVRAAFGDSLSSDTMQGFALAKPHGYAGDFEIIDRIYRVHTAEKPHLSRWDHYFHAQAAPVAVRNRKAYFHRLLDRWSATRPSLRVLNVASGPGRCMYEWLHTRGPDRVSFDCVELDDKAIAFATTLNAPFLPRVRTTRANVLRWRPSDAYDLVWAAGIFDYFRDSVFAAALRRLLQAVADGGELVVGNFGHSNPSRAYMETVGDWRLHHRSAEELIALAAAAGVDRERCRVGAEEAGVNLFLHVQK
jgi:extracellular factor (EF) 3-hydroxypalmitic acid methyl ester biosynthesis protein